MKQLELEFQGPLGGSMRLSDDTLRKRIAQLPEEEKEETRVGILGATVPFYEKAFGFDLSTFDDYLLHKYGGAGHRWEREPIDNPVKYNTVKHMRALRMMDYADIATKIHEEMRETNSDIYNLPVNVSTAISNTCSFTKTIDVAKKFAQAWAASAASGVKIPPLIANGIFDNKLFDIRIFESHAQALIDTRKMTEQQYKLLLELSEVEDKFKSNIFLMLEFPLQRNYMLKVLDKYVK